MHHIALAYLLIAIAAAPLLVGAGRRARAAYHPPARRHRPASPADAIADAIAQLGPSIASHRVHVDIAPPPASAPARPVPLMAELTQALLAVAIQSAPSGNILVAAEERNDQVEVRVTDDAPAIDGAIRKACTCTLAARAALAGGSLHVRVTPDAGTTMTLRFAAVRPGAAQLL